MTLRYYILGALVSVNLPLKFLTVKIDIYVINQLLVFVLELPQTCLQVELTLTERLARQGLLPNRKREVNDFKAAQDPYYHYVCIYLEYARTATSEVDGKRNIHEIYF